MNVLGIDCSRWQDDNSTAQQMDFEKSYNAGARFVFIKASQGRWVDEDFLYNWKASKGILHRGAYHYLDASASGKAQAEFFLGVIHEDMGELPVVVDYEYRSQPKSKMFPIFVQFIDTIHQEGFFPMIYTSPYYWENWGQNDDYWKLFMLWIANYEVSKPKIPKPWSDWDFWQKSCKGNGIYFGAESQYIDINEYKGTWDQFTTRFGSIGEEPPPVVEDRYWLGYGDAIDEMKDLLVQMDNTIP